MYTRYIHVVPKYSGVFVTLPVISLLIFLISIGWEGRYCGNDLDGCSELTCFEGVQCYDVPAPGSGAICGSCPDGYMGDGEKCAGIPTGFLCLMSWRGLNPIH